jgi:hypothetical protein
MISQKLCPAFFLEYLASIWVINCLAGIVISGKILGLEIPAINSETVEKVQFCPFF